MIPVSKVRVAVAYRLLGRPLKVGTVSNVKPYRIIFGKRCSVSRRLLVRVLVGPVVEKVNLVGLSRRPPSRRRKVLVRVVIKARIRVKVVRTRVSRRVGLTVSMAMATVGGD